MRNLIDVLAALYASEINCSISCLWDGGWDVKLGDAMNGFVAETMIRDLTVVGDWLHAEALKHFPESAYARNAP